MRGPRAIGALVILLSFAWSAHAQQQRPESDTYVLPTDVQAVGGGEEAESDNYILDDTIGEANIGLSRSDTYDLNAGYRQTLETFLSLTCSASVNIGTITFVGQATGSGSCTVISDAEAGYSLSWRSSGATMRASGGDTIAAFTPAVADTPEAWSVAPTASEWGARLRSSSTDTAVEWGTDGSSDAWLNVTAGSSRTIVTRTSRTDVAGSTEIIQFRVEVGGSALQPAGTYSTMILLTASSL